QSRCHAELGDLSRRWCRNLPRRGDVQRRAPDSPRDPRRRFTACLGLKLLDFAARGDMWVRATREGRRPPHPTSLRQAQPDLQVSYSVRPKTHIDIMQAHPMRSLLAAVVVLSPACIETSKPVLETADLRVTPDDIHDAIGIAVGPDFGCALVRDGSIAC